jgi:hypothetical protein
MPRDRAAQIPQPTGPQPPRAGLLAAPTPALEVRAAVAERSRRTSLAPQRGQATVLASAARTMSSSKARPQAWQLYS